MKNRHRPVHRITSAAHAPCPSCGGNTMELEFARDFDADLCLGVARCSGCGRVEALSSGDPVRRFGLEVDGFACPSCGAQGARAVLACAPGDSAAHPCDFEMHCTHCGGARAAA